MGLKENKSYPVEGEGGVSVVTPLTLYFTKKQILEGQLV